MLENFDSKAREDAYKRNILLWDFCMSYTWHHDTFNTLLLF